MRFEDRSLFIPLDNEKSIILETLFRPFQRNIRTREGHEIPEKAVFTRI